MQRKSKKKKQPTCFLILNNDKLAKNRKFVAHEIYIRDK